MEYLTLHSLDCCPLPASLIGRYFLCKLAATVLFSQVIGLEEVEGLLGPRPFDLTGELRNIDRCALF